MRRSRVGLCGVGVCIVGLVMPGMIRAQEEDEAQVQAEVNHTEDQLIGAIAAEGRRLVQGTGRALKAEGKRDLDLLENGPKKPHVPSEPPSIQPNGAPTPDDSIESIERDIDALEHNR